MKMYKCFILDDEPLALKVIEQHLSRFNQFTICGTSTDPLTALGEIRTSQPDLFFLDIAMPGLTGLELIAAMQHKPAVILTTAYREYAVEGFDLMVLDYLVKPIAFTRFVKAIDKFLESKAGVPGIGKTKTDHLLIKADRKTVRVDFDDILYIQGVKDYVLVVTANQRLITKMTMSQFLQLLPGPDFMQVHKSFIVAKAKIDAFTAHEIEIGGMDIPIGRMYKEQFETEMRK
jgi:two-component system LytT family response regulator